MNIGVRLFACLMVLMGVVFGTFFWLPTSISYRITEHYSIMIGETDAMVSLGILVPKSGPYQRVKDLSVDWKGSIDVEDTSSVSVVKLSGEGKAGQEIEANVRYDVQITHGLIFWWADVDDSYRLPQPLIESNHPEIVTLAQSLTRGSMIRDSYQIFNFTANYIKQVDEIDDCVGSASALETLRTATGECGEYSRLMVALCRAGNIPARVVSGLILPEFEFIRGERHNDGDHLGEAHAWVEFDTEFGWSIADPAIGAAGIKPLYFIHNDGRHLLYGGVELEGNVFQSLRSWALENGSIIGKRFAGLKYIASASHKDVVIVPSVSVEKLWDGRWANTLIILTAITFLFSRISQRYMAQLTSTGA